MLRMRPASHEEMIGLRTSGTRCAIPGPLGHKIIRRLSTLSNGPTGVKSGRNEADLAKRLPIEGQRIIRVDKRTM